MNLFRLAIFGEFFLVLYSCSKNASLNKGLDDAFIDKRDNEVYKTANFGEQVWMTENLRFKTDSAYSSRFLPKNYGLLYIWTDACRACPEGWHLPSEDEWVQLECFLGLPKDSIWSDEARKIAKLAEKLKFSSEWDESGNNQSGWNALPAGSYRFMFIDVGIGTQHIGLGYEAYFWTATKWGKTGAKCREIIENTCYSGSDAIWHAFSVRCVKDKNKK